MFLGITSLLCWEFNFYFAFSTFSINYDPSAKYKLLVGPFHFLDQYLFHTGYDPKIHDSFPQDNHFGTVYYLSILLFAVIGALIWSLLDRKRLNYNRLSHWFNLYMRYILAVTVLGYGLDKLIPVQMHYPNIENMAMPLGDQSLFRVLWNFMGLSPGYMMMIGACEITAAILLFFRRTFVFGSVLMFGILINVVAMNWFYNIPVKMFSTQLLVYTIFILAPYAGKLLAFFFSGKPVTIAPEHYSFTTKWKKLLLSGLMIIIALLIIVPVIFNDTNRYKSLQKSARTEKMYDVTTFVAKDTLPPLTTDTLRWNRLMLFVQGNEAVIFNMKNKEDTYQVDVDSLKKTYTFHDSPDKKKWNIFNYSFPAKGELKLTGKWKNQDINVLLQQISADSIPLNQEKIKLMND